MAEDQPEYRLDKTAFSVANLTDEPDERAYWRPSSSANISMVTSPLLAEFR
jgi:hypothetical protein